MMKAFVTLIALFTLVAGLPCHHKPAASASGSTTTSAGNSTAPASSNNTSTNGASRFATGWYPGWLNSALPPSQLPWEKYSTLTYAFATTSEDVNKLDLPDPESVLQDFVSQARSHGVKALVSVGGWTGSQFFSSHVASASNRTAFVKTLVDFANKYGIDGIDFDWEYPNKQGIGCNIVSKDDAANFLELLKELRTKVPSDFQLTAAVGITPFNGQDGQPMSDVSGFAKVLNRLAIMAYDINGAWSTIGAGPNAPLFDSCLPAQAQIGSGDSAVKAWTAAGFPANQILLGVPSYGRGYTVSSSEIGNNANKLAQFPSFSNATMPPGTGETAGTTGVDQCGAVTGPSGIFDFSDLIKKGYLDANGNASSTVLSKFDDCSKTPYLYVPESQLFISYDDASSFHAKGKYIQEKSLAGFAMWHVASDSPTNILLDTIISSM